MKIRALLLAAAVIAIAAPAAWAHDGHAHLVMGTVTARSPGDVKVKTPGGEVLTIAITAKTAVMRGKQKISVNEVQVGRRVVVDIGNGEDPLIARAIVLGAALPAATPPAH